MKTKKAEDVPMSRHTLAIARKVVSGTTVGYIVGWRFLRYVWNEGTRLTGFRNIRKDLVFPTERTARAFRNDVENGRKAFVTEFQILD